MKVAIIFGALIIAATIVWTQVDFCGPVRAYIRAAVMKKTENGVAQALYTFMPDRMIDALMAQAGHPLVSWKCIAWDLGFIRPPPPTGASDTGDGAPRSGGGGSLR